MRRRPQRRQVIRRILLVLIVIAALMTILPAIDTNWWPIRLLSFLRVQVMWALVALFAVSLALPDRRRLTAVLSSAVAAGALAGQMVVLFPWSPFAAEPVMALEACPTGARLRVFAANVQMTNEHARELFVEIDRTDPDVVLVQEIDHWWHDQLESLYDDYPYHVNHVTQNYFGISLLSRYRLVDEQVVFMADARAPTVIAGIALPAGPTIRFYGVHPRPLAIGQSTAARDAVLMETALRMAAEQGPLIIAGDLNATPWSPVVRRLARIAQLNDPRIGRGWFPTWKADGVIRRWPLDHVLVSDDFILGDYRVLPSFGSDHLPVLSTVCHAPDLAADTAPMPEPRDLAAAREAIRVGQNEAVPSPEPPPGAQRPR